ncbi:neuropeptide CCHamide-2 receptor-like [Lineus longissimus]|uniref:neuropeptide CCHamide-2 receptor-like n=1 Tax=Lineus longissimus TaxID=88925 RepID=UPI00315D1182
MTSTSGCVVAVVASIIFILVCLGNGTLIFLIVKHKKLRTIQNAFLLSISVADLLVGVVCLPVFGATYAFPNTWMFGVAMCKIYGCLTTVCPALSIFTLTFLSIECCTNIYRQSSTSGLSSYGKVAILFLLWFVCLCLGLPNLIFANITTLQYGEQADICFQHPVHLQGSYTRVDALVRLFIFLVIPALIIAVCFTLIAVKVFSIGYWSTSAGGNVYPTNSETTQEAEEEQSLSQVADPRISAGTESRYPILIMTLSAAFTFCWIPFHVYMMWFFYDSAEFSHAWHVFRLFALCLCFADCCVRPWIVFGLEKTFNHYFKKHLWCCVKRTASNEMIPLNENGEQ